jgi:hypothetical protein
MLRMNWFRSSEPSSHPGIGTANPPVRLTQEQSFHAAGYDGERIRKIFLHSDIDHRHFSWQAKSPKLYWNSRITISGFDPSRSGGPQVPAPLEVKTCILPIWLKPYTNCR